MEVYRVMVAVGLRLVSMIRTMNGMGSVTLYIVLWPFVIVYIG